MTIREVYEKYRRFDADLCNILRCSLDEAFGYGEDETNPPFILTQLWQAIKAHIAQDKSNGAILEAIQTWARSLEQTQTVCQAPAKYARFVKDLATGEWPEVKP